jgi:hypothetical protein
MYLEQVLRRTYKKIKKNRKSFFSIEKEQKVGQLGPILQTMQDCMRNIKLSSWFDRKTFEV